MAKNVIQLSISFLCFINLQ